MNQLSALVHFHFHSEHQYVPAALQVFQAKIINQLLSEVPVWITAASYEIDCIAALFLRKILGIPNTIRLATLLSELELHFPTTLAWLSTIKFWLHLHFQKYSQSLLSDLLSDPFILSLIHI